MMTATPISPKNPQKPAKPKHLCIPGSGTNPRKARAPRKPRAEMLISLIARGDVKLLPSAKGRERMKMSKLFEA